jgi:hypothetical protein
MKRTLLIWIFVISAAALAGGAAPSNEEVAARKTAFDLAGAFSNDGFKLRDGHWMGKIAPEKCKVIQVNLYAGNEYWFSVGATDSAKKLAVSVYDETGKAVDFEPYGEGATAAAGFSPSVSGPYYVKIQELEGGPASFCLLYSYK